jgi:NAD(P)-dependent dehydrogenase (short-subunit alcohol dehydrogenase family)
LDALVNNAGAIFPSSRISVDGIEMTFTLKHLGNFLLTTLPLDLLKNSALALIEYCIGDSGLPPAGSPPANDTVPSGSVVGLREYAEYDRNQDGLSSYGDPLEGTWGETKTSKTRTMLGTGVGTRPLLPAWKLQFPLVRISQRTGGP